jgi:hypothetical protein
MIDIFGRIAIGGMDGAVDSDATAPSLNWRELIYNILMHFSMRNDSRLSILTALP